MASKAKSLSIFDPTLLGPAVGQAFTKLDPRQLFRNPVIFVTEVVAVVVTLMFAVDLFRSIGDAVFSGQIALWLWATVLFATLAEAVAEGRHRPDRRVGGRDQAGGEAPGVEVRDEAGGADDVDGASRPVGSPAAMANQRR